MAKQKIIFTDNLDEVLGALENALEKGLVDIGAKAQSYAREITPVRTGTLRNSIGVEVKPDEKAAYIGTMVDKFPEKPYGKYVELGARGHAGVHMLQRAASEHASEYKKIMEDEMKNA
jgi:hypothetical protein